MSGAKKYESMALSADFKVLFGGNLAGELVAIDVESFSVQSRHWVHRGAVQAIAVHPRLPFIAALGSDRCVSIHRRIETGLSPVAYVSLRQFRANNDPVDVPFVHSTSQALAFHDTEARLVTRTANSALLEIDFDEVGNIDVRSCTRLHGTSDLTSARYAVGETAVLSGSIDGSLVYSLDGRVLRRWQLDHRANIHWAEHIHGSEYVLATDHRNLVRIDLNQPDSLVVGAMFTRDDLEHVTINRTTGSAYCASFDRTIYHVDVASCAPIGVAFKAPFKCRWIRAFGADPETILVQCRNGGLYKVAVGCGVLAELKETPAATWTSVWIGRDLWLSGEGSILARLTFTSRRADDKRPCFTQSRFDLPEGKATYVKRMALVHGDTLVLGRTDGTLSFVETRSGEPVPRRAVQIGSAIRDLAVNGDSSRLFVACEDSSVRALRLDTVAEVARWHGDPLEPIWSIAHSPEAGIVAAAERGGKLALLDDKDLSLLSYSVPSGRPKRMKFLDASTLFFVNRDQLHVLDLASGTVSTRIQSRGNTIEDFVWDYQRRYLVTVGYTQTIGLFDFQSGEELCEVPDQLDYSKGLAWCSGGAGMQGQAGPLDFITFGRSGRYHLFRIHDEKIFGLGEVDAIATLEERSCAESRSFAA